MLCSFCLGVLIVQLDLWELPAHPVRADFSCVLAQRKEKGVWVLPAVLWVPF